MEDPTECKEKVDFCEALQRIMAEKNGPRLTRQEEIMLEQAALAEEAAKYSNFIVGAAA